MPGSGTAVPWGRLPTAWLSRSPPQPGLWECWSPRTLASLVSLTHLVGVSQFRVVAVICISLMVNDLEHLFLGLLTILKFSSVKYLFRSFSIFEFFFYFCFEISLYTLDTSPESAGLQIFSPSLRLVSSLSSVFQRVNILNFDEVQFHNFFLLWVMLRVSSCCAHFTSERVTGQEPAVLTWSG